MWTPGRAPDTAGRRGQSCATRTSPSRQWPQHPQNPFSPKLNPVVPKLLFPHFYTRFSLSHSPPPCYGARRALEPELSLKGCTVFVKPSDVYRNASTPADNCLKAVETFFRKGEQTSKQRQTLPLSACNTFLSACHHMYFGASKSHMKEMDHFCMSGLPLHHTSCVFAGTVSNTAVSLAEGDMPECSLMQQHHLP